jgi:hypothetical protein
VGGSTLSLIFLPQPALIVETIFVFGMILLAPVLVFFLNMMSARRIVVRAKSREMKMARDGLVAASQAMRGEADQGDPEEMSALLGQFSA